MGVIAFRRLSMFAHDAYSGTNGFLTLFVECSQLKWQVNNGRHANKIDNDMKELSYHYRDIFDLSYRLSIENSI